MISSKVNLIAIEKLKEHEETDTIRLNKLKKETGVDGFLKMPIAVDKNTNVVLDGHHRLQTLKQLGYKKIPVIFVDYNSPNISVQAWRKGEAVTKEVVIAAALSGNKLPAKTSKHMIQINGSKQHISAIEKKVNIPLNKLK